MLGRRKTRFLLLLLALLAGVGLFRIYYRSNQSTTAAVLGLWFNVPCRQPVIAAIDQFRRVAPHCAAWPRQNPYFVSQGTLKRSRHIKRGDVRCYLLAPNGQTARLLGDEDTPVRASVLRIDCHDDAARGAPPLRLMLPSIPKPFPRLKADNSMRNDEQWNILVLGIGGLTRHLLEEALPQAMDIFVKEMRGAILSKLVPQNEDENDNLLELLRYKSTGPWITNEFQRQGYLTQSAILTHPSRTAEVPSPPAMFNLSSYISARSSVATPGCVGGVAEGSVLMAWVREFLLLNAANNKVFSFLHFSDLVFPSLQRLDAELVSLLLEYLHFDVYSRTALILYSLPDHRSGLEPGLLVVHPPPRFRSSAQFRWDMLHSAFAVGDFFTPADLNRMLAFLASNQRPSLLADIGRDARSCTSLRISPRVCRCIDG